MKTTKKTPVKNNNEQQPRAKKPHQPQVAAARTFIEDPSKPNFSVGTLVVIQRPGSTAWDMTGTVIESYQNGRCLKVQLANQKVYWRNRKHVRLAVPMPSVHKHPKQIRKSRNKMRHKILEKGGVPYYPYGGGPPGAPTKPVDPPSPKKKDLLPEHLQAPKKPVIKQEPEEVVIVKPEPADTTQGPGSRHLNVPANLGMDFFWMVPGGRMMAQGEEDPVQLLSRLSGIEFTVQPEDSKRYNELTANSIPALMTDFDIKHFHLH